MVFPRGCRSSSCTRCKLPDRTNKTGTDRPRNRKRETVPLPERKGGQLAVTRRTCLDQLSDAAAAARYIASMHRAALDALLDGVTLISAHSLAGLPRGARAANYSITLRAKIALPISV